MIVTLRNLVGPPDIVESGSIADIRAMCSSIRIEGDFLIPVGLSPNRKLLVKDQHAQSVNPAARRFGNSASPRPQIDCLPEGVTRSHQR